MSATTQSYLKKYGRPHALYADRGNVFKVNNAHNPDLHETQFERMLKELGIKLIHAYSPQAKGRVERLFRTLQDRLVKELRLRNITTIAEANKYLSEIFINEFNAKSYPPKSSDNLHRSIESYDFNTIFCAKENRKLNIE